MRLLFATQRLDEDDAVLGFTADWVRALARRVDAMTVVANGVGRVPDDLGADVISLGRERGAGRFTRTVRYERIVAGLTDGRIDTLFAHMCPVYLNLAAPWVRPRHVRSILWFAHPQITPTLRIADRLADTILTSLPGSYPLDGPNVRTIGQAVDVEAFPFSPRQRSRPLRVLGVGRTSPSKGFDTSVRAVARARASGFDVQLRIIGPSTTPEEERHRVELATLIRERLGDAGTLDPGVPHAEIASAIAAADILVSDMVAGSGDKVVFEAAALGRPVVVSNPSFGELLADLPLELRFTRGDDAALADVIGSLVAAEDEMIASTVKELRTRVERDHSLDGWADRVASIAGGGV